MKEINRFYIMGNKLSLDDGSPVSFKDHAAIVAEKDARISELELMLQKNAVKDGNEIAALQEQVRALAAENVLIKSSVPNLKDIEFDNENMDDASLGEDIGFNDAVELMKNSLSQTPSTDAALREIRAQGVDAFAVDCKVKASKENLVFWMDASSAAEEFAARIRAGEKQ